MRSIAAMLLTLVLALSLGSCQAGRVTAKVAQEMLTPWSFGFVGKVEGNAYANARFVALDAHVMVDVRVYGPRTYGGPIEVLKNVSFEKDAHQRAYELVIHMNPDKPIAEFKKVDWEYVRQFMPQLPAARPSPNAVPASVENVLWN